MYMKSLVSLAVLGAMSTVATAGDHVVFDKPNESYTVDGLRKLFKSTLNNRLCSNLACVIDESSRGVKLKRAFEELP